MREASNYEAPARKWHVVTAMVGPGRSSLSILFTHFGESWIRGSEQVLLDIINNLDRSRFTPLVWCNAAPVADLLLKAGITVYRSDFSSFFAYGSPRFSLSRYLSFVREGLTIVKRHRVHLLHANGAAPTQWLLPVSHIAGIPLVAHLHANYLRRERYTTLLHHVTSVVGVSHRVVRDLLSDGMPAERIRVIHNGIDLGRFRPARNNAMRGELGIGENAILVACVGSLIPRKGMDLLIQGLGRVQDPNVHVAIAGEGPEQSALRHLVDALGLQSRVHFLGYRQDISPLYAAADIAALASRSEAFGLALAEASYFSLPIVSHDLPGISEVVQDGITGILVPAGQPQALAGALARLAADPQERRNLGNAGKQRVLEHFSHTRMVTEFQSLYAQLAEPPGPGQNVARSGLRPYFRLLRSMGHKASGDASPLPVG